MATNTHKINLLKVNCINPQTQTDSAKFIQVGHKTWKLIINWNLTIQAKITWKNLEFEKLKNNWKNLEFCTKIM